MNAPWNNAVEPQGFYGRELRNGYATLRQVRSDLRRYLALHAVPADTAADTILALQEAAKNALHASAGRPVSITVWVRTGHVQARIRDCGAGFDIADPNARPRAWQTHGRGLYLMHALMDDVEIDCSSGVTVTMRRRLLRGEVA